MAENNSFIRKLHIIQSIFLLLIILFSQSYAQFSFYTNVNSYFDDNIFNNYLAEQDFINSFSLGTAFDIESKYNNLSTYYDGNFTLFNEYNQKSSNLHKVGIVNTYFLNEANPLNIGVNLSMKNYRDDYSIYDWQTISAYANYRHLTGENDFILAGYIFGRTKYNNLDIFSYYEHKGLIKLQFAFETKTTVLISGEAGYKDYMQQLNQSDFTNNIWQASSFLRVAQSLGENTGMSLFTGIRKNFKDGTRYLNNNDYYYFEEELLNDQYSSDGFEGGTRITQLLTPIMILSGFVNYAQNNYTNLTAADLEGNSLGDFREDKRLSFGVKLEVNLVSILPGLFGDVNWNFIRNNSNDTFYDYDNQIFAAGLEFNF